MKNLDLLWELQNHSKVLDEAKDNFQRMANGQEIQTLELRLRKTEEELADLEEKIDSSDSRLSKNNFMLKEYDYHLKKIEEELYKGDISDAKQLKHLDDERKSMEKNIENKEMEILEQLENMEELQGEFTGIEYDFKVLKREYNVLIKQYRAAIEDFKQKIMESKNEIDNISSRVDKDILERYDKIKYIKGNAVVEVVDQKCSGCNMMLSTFMIDKLKEDNEILFCESCGRILYLKVYPHEE